MALWGISTTTETSANNFNLPKFVKTVARPHTRHNVFADSRGWVERHYKTQENSGLSTSYYDEVLVPIVGLATNGGGANTKGLNAATPVAVFFEDPNKSSNISVGSGGTSGIGTGTTGYVHLVYNELVFAGAGATIAITRKNANGTVLGTIVATASSVNPDAVVANWTYPAYTADNPSSVLTKGYNGQITNRIAFAFTVPSTGIGTVLTINETNGVIGVITDINNNNAETSLTGLTYNVGGAGTAFSVQNDGVTPVGIGTHTLTIEA